MAETLTNYPGKYFGTSQRQLNDLRKKPSVTTLNGQIFSDHRPLFDLGELPEAHPDFGRPPMWGDEKFRQLLWHPTTGEEVFASNQSEVNSLHNRGYLDYPPNAQVVPPVVAAKSALDGLKQDERDRVLAAVRKQKLEAIQAQLAQLSESELAEIQAPPKVRTA